MRVGVASEARVPLPKAPLDGRSVNGRIVLFLGPQWNMATDAFYSNILDIDNKKIDNVNYYRWLDRG